MDDPRNGPFLRRRVGPATELRTAEGFHGEALAAHVGNARVKESAAGIQVRKTDRASPQRIDLAVCAVMAHDRATRARGRAAIDPSCI